MTKELKQLDTFPNRLSSLSLTAGRLSWSEKQKNRKQYNTKIHDCTLVCKQTVHNNEILGSVLSNLI